MKLEKWIIVIAAVAMLAMILHGVVQFIDFYSHAVEMIHQNTVNQRMIGT